MDVHECAWSQRIQFSTLPDCEKKTLRCLLRGLLLGTLRERPAQPLEYWKMHIERKIAEAAVFYGKPGWEVPQSYDYTKPTSEVHKVPGTHVEGPHADIRQRLDFSYHNNYSLSRQGVQDVLVGNVVSSASPKEHPWLVFTAGAMGAGKSHTIRWMSEHGYFPLPDIVQIDPDRFKEQFPEWEGYLRYNPLKAGSMVHKESGYLVEIAQEASLRQKKNVWVDGSMRDGAWYSQQLQEIKRQHPEYRIAILHVYADLETILQRAEERARSTGRRVPREDIIDSYNKVPEVVEHLAAYTDFIAHIKNDGGDPQLTEYCNRDGCTLNVAGEWDEVKARFATDYDGTASDSVRRYVDEILDTHPIVVFTKSYCTYCSKLLVLLSSAGIRPHLVELDSMPGGGISVQLELSRRTHFHTVPLLFSKGKLVGGSDAVAKLHATVGLSALSHEVETAFTAPIQRPTKLQRSSL